MFPEELTWLMPVWLACLRVFLIPVEQGVQERGNKPPSSFFLRRCTRRSGICEVNQQPPPLSAAPLRYLTGGRTEVGTSRLPVQNGVP